MPAIEERLLAIQNSALQHIAAYQHNTTEIKALLRELKEAQDNVKDVVQHINSGKAKFRLEMPTSKSNIAPPEVAAGGNGAILNNNEIASGYEIDTAMSSNAAISSASSSLQGL